MLQALVSAYLQTVVQLQNLFRPTAFLYHSQMHQNFIKTKLGPLLKVTVVYRAYFEQMILHWTEKQEETTE